MEQKFEYLATVKDPKGFIHDSLDQNTSQLRSLLRKMNGQQRKRALKSQLSQRRTQLSPFEKVMQE